jgi:hypothetical protein
MDRADVTRQWMASNLTAFDIPDQDGAIPRARDNMYAIR